MKHIVIRDPSMCSKLYSITNKLDDILLTLKTSPNQTQPLSLLLVDGFKKKRLKACC